MRSQSSPRITGIHTIPEVPKEGEVLELIGTVHAASQVEYKWLFNGQPISGKDQHFLKIDSFKAADCGNYQLEVTDRDKVKGMSSVYVLRIGLQNDMEDPQDKAAGEVESASKHTQHLSALVELVHKFEQRMTVGAICGGVSIFLLITWLVNKSFESIDKMEKEAETRSEKVKENLNKDFSIFKKEYQDRLVTQLNRVEADSKEMASSVNSKIERVVEEAKLRLTGDKLNESLYTDLKRKMESQLQSKLVDDTLGYAIANLADVSQDARAQLLDSPKSDENGRYFYIVYSEAEQLKREYYARLSSGELKGERCVALIGAVEGLRALGENRVKDAREWYNLAILRDSTFTEGNCLLLSSYLYDLSFIPKTKTWSNPANAAKALELIGYMARRTNEVDGLYCKALMSWRPVLEDLSKKSQEETVKAFLSSINDAKALCDGEGNSSGAAKHRYSPILSRLNHWIGLRYRDLINLYGPNEEYRKLAIEHFVKAAQQEKINVAAINNALWFITHSGEGTLLVETNQSKWYDTSDFVYSLFKRGCEIRRLKQTESGLSTLAEAAYALGDFVMAEELAEACLKAQSDAWVRDHGPNASGPAYETYLVTVEENRKWHDAIKGHRLLQLQLGSSQ